MTIQMKALYLYLHMVLFENEIWRFGRNLPLVTFGSERVKGITIAVDTHNLIILHGNPQKRCNIGTSCLTLFLLFCRQTNPSFTFVSHYIHNKNYS